MSADPERPSSLRRQRAKSSIGSPATEFSPSVQMAAVSRSEMAHARFGSWIPPGSPHPSPSRCNPFRGRPTSTPATLNSPSQVKGSWWPAPRPARSPRHSSVLTARSPRPNFDRPASWSRPESTVRSSHGISATGRRTFPTVLSYRTKCGSNPMSAPSCSRSSTEVGSMSSPSRRCGQEHACQIAGRVLTEEEWGELLGARPYAPACGE